MTLHRSRNPGLDTLRAAAIVLVFVYHYMCFVSGEPTFGAASVGGWVGVDLFFVLSGYLMANQIFSGVVRGRQLSLRQHAKYFPAVFGNQQAAGWDRFATRGCSLRSRIIPRIVPGQSCRARTRLSRNACRCSRIRRHCRSIACRRRRCSMGRSIGPDPTHALRDAQPESERDDHAQCSQSPGKRAKPSALRDFGDHS